MCMYMYVCICVYIYIYIYIYIYVSAFAAAAVAAAVRGYRGWVWGAGAGGRAPIARPEVEQTSVRTILAYLPRDHANIPCAVPNSTGDPQRESITCVQTYKAEREIDR